MENINTLHIISHLPSDKIPIAGQILSYNWMVNSKESKQSYVVVVCNEGELDFVQKNLNNLCGKLEIYTHTRNSKILNTLKNISIPYYFANRLSEQVIRRINELVETYQFKRVRYEFTSSYGFYFKIQNVENIQHEFIAHDVSFQALFRKYKSLKGLKKLFYFFEYIRVKRLEVALFKKNKVFVLSQKDKDLLLEENITTGNIHIRRPILSPWLNKVIRNEIIKNSILFVGGLHREENLTGIKLFIENILPPLVNRFPDISLTIVGKNPENLGDKTLNHPNINATGVVQDLKPIFETTAVAISPLIIGAGVKIKTLEYLKAGIPTIATPIGAEGIDDNPLLFIADNDESFFRRISELFELE